MVLALVKVGTLNPFYYIKTHLSNHLNLMAAQKENEFMIYGS